MIRLFAILTLVAGCNSGQQSDKGSSESQASPAAQRLHGELLDAARANNIEGFKALLSVSSVALMETHFDTMSQLDRPDGTAPYGWQNILRFHAGLPETAAKTAPYPIVQEQGTTKLDLAGHNTARFFEAVQATIHRAALETPPADAP
jgi:hypothetical protein